MLVFRKRLDLARFVGLSVDEIRALVDDARTRLLVGREPVPEGWPAFIRRKVAGGTFAFNERTGEKSPPIRYVNVTWSAQDVLGQWRHYAVQDYRYDPELGPSPDGFTAYVFARGRSWVGTERCFPRALLRFSEPGVCVRAERSRRERLRGWLGRLSWRYHALRRRLRGIGITEVDDLEYWKTGRRGTSRDVPS